MRRIGVRKDFIGDLIRCNVRNCFWILISHRRLYDEMIRWHTSGMTRDNRFKQGETSVFQKGLRSGFAIGKQNLLTLELPHFGCMFLCLGEQSKKM